MTTDSTSPELITRLTEHLTDVLVEQRRALVPTPAELARADQLLAESRQAQTEFMDRMTARVDAAGRGSRWEMGSADQAIAGIALILVLAELRVRHTCPHVGLERAGERVSTVNLGLAAWHCAECPTLPLGVVGVLDDQCDACHGDAPGHLFRSVAVTVAQFRLVGEVGNCCFPLFERAAGL